MWTWCAVWVYMLSCMNCKNEKRQGIIIGLLWASCEELLVMHELVFRNWRRRVTRRWWKVWWIWSTVWRTSFTTSPSCSSSLNEKPARGLRYSIKWIRFQICNESGFRFSEKFIRLMSLKWVSLWICETDFVVNPYPVSIIEYNLSLYQMHTHAHS